MGNHLRSLYCPFVWAHNSYHFFNWFFLTKILFVLVIKPSAECVLMLTSNMFVCYLTTVTTGQCWCSTEWGTWAGNISCHSIYGNCTTWGYSEACTRYVGLMPRDPIFVMFFFVVMQYIMENFKRIRLHDLLCRLKRHCSELLQYSRCIIMYFSMPYTFPFFYLFFFFTMCFKIYWLGISAIERMFVLNIVLVHWYTYWSNDVCSAALHAPLALCFCDVSVSLLKIGFKGVGFENKRWGYLSCDTEVGLLWGKHGNEGKVI